MKTWQVSCGEVLTLLLFPVALGEGKLGADERFPA